MESQVSNSEDKKTFKENVSLIKKDEKLGAHYKGGRSLSLLNDDLSAEEKIQIISSEMMKESDSILANRIIADERGDISVSSACSEKRAGILDKAIKIQHTQRVLDREASIDLDAPVFRHVYGHFFFALKETLNSNGIENQQMNHILKKLAENLTDWKSQVKKSIKNRKDTESGQ